MKNLDSSWKYTTKTNLHPGERLLRESLYREGASDFQEKLIKSLETDTNPQGDYNIEEIIEIVKTLKL